MRIEIKGLLLAIITAAAVLGATFAVSALVRRGQGETASQQTAPAPAAGNAGPASNAGSAALVLQGHQFYTQSCASCHGTNANGGYGPSLHNEDMNDVKIASVITQGVKGRMPAFGSKYSVTQTHALVAYIRTLK